MKIVSLAAFLLLYIVIGRGDLLGDIGSGLLNVAEQGFEAIDYGLESVDDIYIIGSDGIPIRVGITDFIPETVEQTQKDLPNRVFFYLYTRNNPSDSQQLNVSDTDTLENSNFNVSKYTAILIHGWNSNSSGFVDVKDAVLQNCDCNAILVDWGAIAEQEYVWSSDRVVIVSQYIAQMIDFLNEEGMDSSNLTVVGLSLGAHVAGLSSYFAQNKANFVVGLDPAQPNFIRAGVGTRLTVGDGKYVQVVHTNAGGNGFNISMGDIDFWANNGQTQNGCSLIDLGCSHVRSQAYYVESLNSTVGFIGRECDSYDDFEQGNCANNPTAVFGGVTPQTNLTGNFYFSTNSESPYAEGAEGAEGAE